MKRTLLIALAALASLPLLARAQETGFQPLTDLPVFDSVKADNSLEGFFNQLYVLCVGAAAVIAVAQIMIAGFRWATSGGSHSTIEEARSGIRNSILGLILVLSPTIVFGIINPDILRLTIDTSPLRRDDAAAIELFCQDVNSRIRNTSGSYDGKGAGPQEWSIDDEDAAINNGCCLAMKREGTVAIGCEVKTSPSVFENERWCDCSPKLSVREGFSYAVDYLEIAHNSTQFQDRGSAQEFTTSYRLTPRNPGSFASEAACKASYDGTNMSDILTNLDRDFKQCSRSNAVGAFTTIACSQITSTTGSIIGMSAFSKTEVHCKEGGYGATGMIIKFTQGSGGDGTLTNYYTFLTNWPQTYSSAAECKSAVEAYYTKDRIHNAIWDGNLTCDPKATNAAQCQTAVSAYRTGNGPTSTALDGVACGVK